MCDGVLPVRDILLSMLWNKYFFPSFLTLSLVGFLHWIGSVEYYYWTVWWYDIMTHFLGGVWVALAVLWVINMPPFAWVRSRTDLLSVVLLTLIVGSAWEIYEVFFGFADPNALKYIGDTLIDLCMDTLGSVAVVLLGVPFITSLKK